MMFVFWFALAALIVVVMSLFGAWVIGGRE